MYTSTLTKKAEVTNISYFYFLAFSRAVIINILTTGNQGFGAYPDRSGVSGADKGVSLESDCALESAAPGDSVEGVLGVDRPDPPPPPASPAAKKYGKYLLYRLPRKCSEAIRKKAECNYPKKGGNKGSVEVTEKHGRYKGSTESRFCPLQVNTFIMSLLNIGLIKIVSSLN